MWALMVTVFNIIHMEYMADLLDLQFKNRAMRPTWLYLKRKWTRSSIIYQTEELDILQ